MGESDERERPSGAVFTMVRISNADPTRPITEVQSGNALITESLWRVEPRDARQTRTTAKPEAQGARIMHPRLTGSSLRNCYASPLIWRSWLPKSTAAA